MLISGIAGRSHEHLNLGDAIPLSVEAKAKEAGKRGWVDNAAEGMEHVVSDVTLVGGVEILEGSPTHYKVQVRVTYWTLRKSDDKLFARRVQTAALIFADSKDTMGLPDIKVVQFKTL